jgi:hypothetical protein
MDKSENLHSIIVDNHDNKDYYSYDYWFNNKEHDNWHQGNENYYVNKFYENIIMKLNDVPKEGKILILGLFWVVCMISMKHLIYVYLRLLQIQQP